MSDTVQQVKDKLSIVDVVQPYVKLVRAGKYWKGLSPFTKEKTPSFFVTPDRGLYHCFSTGKGGDMFTFIQEMEGVDFKGALHLLAEKAGVQVVYQDPGEKDARERIYSALADAEAFFESELEKREAVVKYLENRSIDRETRKHWRIGYAPKEWQALKEALTVKGYTDLELEHAGLIKRADAGENQAPRLYDRFRGRIMFPIKDISGRTIAFSGRIFEDDPLHPQAKYLNSPETSVFDKSRALYGIHEAKNAIREMRFSMLVEGQVDLVLSHKAGYRNAVATSGTSFTEHHADTLKRYAPNLLIAYDGDRAGIAAAFRASLLALPKGLNVKVARLPDGKDPADLIRENSNLFKESVKRAEHSVDYFLKTALEGASDQRTQRLLATEQVLPLIRSIPNAIDQAHFVERVATELGVSADAIRSELIRSSQVIASTGSVQAAPLSNEMYRDQFLFGIYLILIEDGRASEAALLRSMLEREYGPAVIEQLSAGSEDALLQAKIRASEDFFAVHTDEGEQIKAIEEMRVESEDRWFKQERLRLQRMIRHAAEQHDAEAEERLLKELRDLAKTSQN